ncbi:MAG: glutamate-1-semialdehyde 2,1-aminomutase, partial [candidate division Zixibacteria bacterium]|nr:glutamate-1-semialdehyde 2,1-aminomutase [candidate division Zixibacteria bacterium]
MVADCDGSKSWLERAINVVPGGVSSPVRAFHAVGGDPIFMERGEGAHLYDVDGNRYLDLCSSWGPLILGHCHPDVVAAVTDAVSRGMSFGTATPTEVELAEIMTEKAKPLETVRFVSSGTEAVMSAVRVARGYTGRDKIVKFDGCYHGHADHFLVRAGSGLATFGTPSSSGVPDDFAKHTLIAELGDEETVQKYFDKCGDDIAAVLIEPIPANNGLLIQRPEFLRFLRAITSKYESILIFDEVISGFRVGWGGAAEMYEIEPDLLTFGKVIGGGMPVGAFG